MIHVNGVYQSMLFSGLPGVVHGFSSRSLGDARVPENEAEVVRRITGTDTRVIGARQVHGADVAIADSRSPRVIPDVDGVVTILPDTVVEVRVADCVPILLVDPIAKVAAAVHAGWRGTLAHIARHAVEKMIRAGATGENIYAAIGPHIGRCCYTVDVDRAEMFLTAFGADTQNAFLAPDGWRLDLGFINRTELIGAGVPAHHIDAPIMCTSCQVDTFFSYRKDTKDTFGEIIGIIGCTK